MRELGRGIDKKKVNICVLYRARQLSLLLLDIFPPISTIINFPRARPIDCLSGRENDTG